MHDLLALFVIQSSALYPTADEWLNDADPQSPHPNKKKSASGIDAADGIEMHALRLVHGLLGSFIGMSEHELIATALWCLHTHTFDLYSHTPRLIFTSPVRGCGKSRTLKVLKQLVRRPRLSGNVIAAVFYHRLENERCSWLLDEGDNLPIYLDPNMRAAFNDGHERGGTVERMYKGEPKTPCRCR